MFTAVVEIDLTADGDIEDALRDLGVDLENADFVAAYHIKSIEETDDKDN
jgi:hypothetical protein